MATCTNCHAHWSFKHVVIAGFSKDGKACPRCGKKQYIATTTQSILTIGSISFLLLLLFPMFIKLSPNKDGYE